MILCIRRYKHYHALAWDGKSNFVIDPLRKKQIVPLKDIKDKIHTIEILTPIEKRKMTFLNLEKLDFDSKISERQQNFNLI